MTIKKNNTGAIVIEGHVQGLANTRALGETGIPVIVIDKNNCIARYSKYCIKFFKCPEYTSSEFILFLIELAKVENLYGWTLIPSNDHIVYNLSKNKETISKVYKTIVPSFDVLIALYDKYNFLNICLNKGIPVPQTYLITEYDKFSSQSTSYPLLVKGREGLSFFKTTGKKGFIVNNKQELDRTLSELKVKINSDKIIIQELIPFNDSGDVWSFCGFSDKGEIKTFWIGKKLREHPVRFGTATLAQSDYNEYVENYGKKIIKILGFSGVCEIEFLRDNRDYSYKLIEINPRTWLWVGLARYCGVDFTGYIYKYLNNIPINFPVDYKKQVKWMNFWTDFFFSMKAIIRKNLKIRDYLNQNKGLIIQAVYERRDKMPFIMMTLMLFYLAKKRSRPGSIK